MKKVELHSNDKSGAEATDATIRMLPGGCQLLHKDSWAKIWGFDERYYGWGSEDQDLIWRARLAKIRAYWLGENPARSNIQLFHQAHGKIDIKKDIKDQNKNKKLLNNIKSYKANPDGWGGIKDDET